MTLNPKQRKFAEAYVELGNATQAAITAGYSEKTAYAQASDLLKNPEVKQRVQDLLAAQTTDRMASASEILAMLTAVMRGEQVEQVALSTPSGVEMVEKRPSIKERIRAAELLGKRHLLWTERGKLDDELTQAKIEALKMETAFKQNMLNDLNETTDPADDGFLMALKGLTGDVWSEDDNLPN